MATVITMDLPIFNGDIMPKIGLQTFGSEGDINPFLLLSEGLSKAGFQVTLLITGLQETDYTEKEKELDITISQVGDSSEEKFNTLFKDLAQASLLKQGEMISDFFLYSNFEDLYESSLKLCKENDIVIGHFGHFPLALAAQSIGVKRVSLFPTAVALPTKNYAPFGLPQLGKVSNTLLWKLIEIGSNMFYKKSINHYCKIVGQKPISDYNNDIAISNTLNLVPFSPELLNYSNKQYTNVHLTGLYQKRRLQSNSLPLEVLNFVSDTTPVCYITFGSLTSIDTNPDETVQLLIDSVKKAKIKAIIQFDWDRCSKIIDPDIYQVTRLPHQDIFPYCSFVVHHGGAGTTQTSIASGVPSVVVSHGADQGFNGWILKNAGACATVLNRKNLTVEKLSKAMETILGNGSYKVSALAVSKKIQNEDGVQRSVELIKELFEK